MIPLGAWLPDRPPVREPHLRDASGVIPAAEGYEPFPGLTVTTDALTARCRGAVGARDIDQAAHIYAGDATKLYELEGSTWTDRSKVGGYTAGDETRWRFIAYGDRLIATNGIEPPQYIEMSTAATAFADLPGSPGAAEFIASFKGFVVLGSLASSAIKIKWSGLEDSEQWTPGTNQSDEQEFPEGGRITGLGAADVLYIFKEKAIIRGVYVGPPAIMQFDTIVTGIGVTEPGSLVQYGRMFWFQHEDGFYSFDGEQCVPIGVEKFDQWFLEDSARAYTYNMDAAVDPLTKTVQWAYPSTSSGGGLPDTILIYNWAVGTPSYVRLQIECFVAALSLGISPDDLTSTDVDALTVSFDDPSFLGGVFYKGAMDYSHRLCSFSGDAVAATLETGDFQINPQGRSLMRYATPIGDATDFTVKIGAKERQGDAFTWGSAVAQEASGRCPTRASGRFFRARLEAPSGSGWTHVNGVEFDAAMAGVR